MTRCRCTAFRPHPCECSCSPVPKKKAKPEDCPCPCPDPKPSVREPHLCLMKAKDFYEYNPPKLPRDKYDPYPPSFCWPAAETSKPKEAPPLRFKYEDGRSIQQLPLSLFKRNGMQDYAYSKNTGTPSYIERF